jgi:hypothetical protein
MIKDVFVVDASAHSYNLAEENYAAGRYSKAVVMSSPLSGQKVMRNRTQPLTRRGLQNDGSFARRCDFASA